MPRHEDCAVSRRHHPGPENTPRLRLKPKATATGYVDGAWWPHSDDLPKELPDLLAVLSVRLGAITRVMYNLTDWAIAPWRLLTGGRAIQLEGYGLHPIRTVEVVGINRKSVLLLVVPSHIGPNHAHDTMMTAAAPNNASTVTDLLMISEPRNRMAAAEPRWTAGD